MMTYIERHGWSSIPISSAICCPNADKSTQPCPILSSSLASTSLISNSNSIPISSDGVSSSSSSSLSYGKRKNTSVFLQRSSLGHPNDYYTTKRIDELHERMDDIQISNFVTFFNDHLSLKTEKKLHIKDLSKDLSNGHILLDLIEILSSTKLKREHGHTRFHSLTNVQHVLDFLKLHIPHINISPQAIVSGNRKQILALLWIIIKTFDFPSFRSTTTKNCFSENIILGFGQDRSIIIIWLNNILNKSLNSEQVLIHDFYIQTWIDNSYLSSILKYLLPLSIKYITIKCFNYLQELDEKNVLTKKENFDICLNLSNYCFNTNTIIDYTDKSEKCLFKYFTELQENIFIILKTNQIGKLIQNNPYTKQILDTVIQTTIEHSHIINNNEQDLICINDDNQQAISSKHTRLTSNSLGYSTSSSDDNDELAHLRTGEKSIDEQEKAKLKRKNRWDTTDLLQSNPQMVNGHSDTSKEQQVKVTNGELKHFTVTAKQLPDGIDELEKPSVSTENIEQATADYEKTDQSTATTEDFKQPSFTDKKTEQTTAVIVENELDQPITKIEENILTTDEYKKSVQTITPPDEIEPHIENKFPVAINGAFEQFTTAVEDTPELIASNEQVEHTIVTDDENKSSLTIEKTLESPALGEPQQPTILNREDKVFLNAYEKSEKPVASFEEMEHTIVTDDENKPSLMINEKLESPALEEPQQSITPNGENQQSLNAYEESEKPVASLEEIQQIIVTDDENKPSLTIEERLESPAFKELQQSTISNVEDKQSLNAYEKSEKPVAPFEEMEHTIITDDENKPSLTIEERLESPAFKEPQQSTIPNGEDKQSLTAYEELEKPVASLEEIEQTVENEHIVTEIEPSEQTSLKITANEPSITTNGELEQPIVELEKPQSLITSTEENKKSTVEQEKLEHIPGLTQAPEQPPENKIPTTTGTELEQCTIKEPPLPVVATEEVSVTHVKNNPSVEANKKIEQSTVEELPQSKRANVQTTITSVATNQRFEQPPVANSQNIWSSFKEKNKSTSVNGRSVKPTATNKEPIQKVPYSTNFNNQLQPSTNGIKKPEQRASIINEPTQPVITSNGNKHSNSADEQFTNSNNESKQDTASSELQDFTVVSKKRTKSSTVLTETSLQPIIIIEENNEVSFSNEPESSEVSVEKHEQPATEEPHASGLSNGEAKKTSAKKKKSKRPNAKKAKSRNSTGNEESQQKAIPDNEEEDEEELSITNIVHEENQYIVESQVQNASTTPKPVPVIPPNDDTSINNENSSALRARKSKKKKTTSTTLLEKSLPPIIPTTNRNVTVIIKEFLHDPKLNSLKYVFILMCLCVSILLILFKSDIY